METILESVKIDDQDVLMLSIYVENNFVERLFFTYYGDAIEYIMNKQMEYQNGNLH